jgi:hypothetical protein
VTVPDSLGTRHRPQVVLRKYRKSTGNGYKHTGTNTPKPTTMRSHGTILLILTIPACHSFLSISNQSHRRSVSVQLASNETPEVYPLSRRKALLIKEAQRLDPSIVQYGKGVFELLCDSICELLNDIIVYFASRCKHS